MEIVPIILYIYILGDYCTPQSSNISIMAGTWHKTIENLAEMQETGTLCDCRIVGDDFDSTKSEYQAHSAVLAASSKYFYNVFVATFNKRNADIPIVLSGVHSKCIEVGISFMYGKVPANMDELQALEQCATTLTIPSALSYVKDQYISVISPCDGLSSKLLNSDDASDLVDVKSEPDILNELNILSEDSADDSLSPKHFQEMFTGSYVTVNDIKISTDTGQYLDTSMNDGYSMLIDEKEASCSYSTNNFNQITKTADSFTVSEQCVKSEVDSYGGGNVSNSVNTKSMRATINCAPMILNKYCVRKAPSQSTSLKLQYLLIKKKAVRCHRMKTAKMNLPQELLKIKDCPFCEKKFTFMKVMKRHINISHLRHASRLKCPLCGIEKKNTYYYRGQMSFHIIKHLMDDNFQHVVLPRGPYKKEKINHDVPIEIPKPNACPYCQRQFIYLKHMRKHINKFHVSESSDELKCPLCDFASKTTTPYMKNKIINHIIHHFLVDSEPQYESAHMKSGEKFPYHKASLVLAKIPKNKSHFLCRHCSAEFTSRNALNFHENLCGSETHPAKCTFCKQFSKTLGDMIFHFQAKHSNEKYFTCCICSETCKSERFISQHFQNAHSIHATYPHLRYIKAVITPINCAMYTQQVIGIMHDDMSQVSRLFTDIHFCSFCNLCFGSQAELVRDIINHITLTEIEIQPYLINQYECHLCGQMASSLKDVHTHIAAMHEGEKGQEVFTCHVCSAKFIKKYCLESHMKTHAEANYVCPVCGKRFRFSQSLNRHRKLHESDRDFLCTFCDYKSNCKLQLEGHENAHKGLKPFQCNLCNRCYSGRKGLLKHKRVKHSENSAGSSIINDQSFLNMMST